MRPLISSLVAASLVCTAPMAAIAAAPPGEATWPDLTTPAAKQGGGAKDAAVIVGVEDYVFAPDIPGAASNAEAWYRHLTSVRGIPPQNLRLLRNDEATLEEMRRAASDAAKVGKSGGTMWFVFIGHGAPSADGDDGLLIGTDAQQTAQSLEARSLRRSELIATLEKGAAQPVVLIDACFSGRGQQGESLAEGLQPLRVAELEAPKSALVLTAAQSNQYAGALPGKDVPAFSYLVLGAMRGWGDADGNGEVTAAEAVEYSGGVMRSVIKGRSQSPDIGGDASVVLGSAAEQGPDLAAIVLAGDQSAATPGPADTGPADPTPAPARAGDGESCVDQGQCREGTRCVDSVCRVDFGYIEKKEKKASRLVIGGSATLGIGAAMIIGGGAWLGTLASGEGGGDNLVIPASVLTGIGLAGAVLGGILLGVGVKRRKDAKALRGAAAWRPTFASDGDHVSFGLQGRF